MTVNVGFGLLIIAFVTTLYGTGAAVYGGIRKASDWLRSARLGALITFPLLSGALGLLEILIFTGRYDVGYVYEVADNNLPFYLKSLQSGVDRVAACCSGAGWYPSSCSFILLDIRKLMSGRPGW